MQQPPIPLWSTDASGQVVAHREAEFWHKTGQGTVQCGLCYRQCALAPEYYGWCGLRVNEDGRMRLAAHGVVSSLVRAIAGYGVDPFLSYKPGQTTLFLGGIECTADCTFCMSTDITWQPWRLPWVGGRVRDMATDDGHYAAKAMLHPQGATLLAEQWGCARILFGINEPTLIYEYVSDTARLAKAAGLDVCLETNGFCGAAVVKELAPYISAVDVGVKGSLDPAFYDKWMKSPGAVPTVLESAKAWREEGVFVLMGDLIAPPQMQSDAAFEAHAKRFYAWTAEQLGPHTPVLITAIERPGPMRSGVQTSHWLLRARDGDAAVIAYELRQQRALELARAAGLAYAHRKRRTEQIVCHACGGVLLAFREWCSLGWAQSRGAADRIDDACVMPRTFCPWWAHDQHITDGRCDHCGAAVPLVGMAPEELEMARRTVRSAAGQLLARVRA